MISNTKIGVIGLRYVNLPLARLFATKYRMAHVAFLDLDLASLQNDTSLLYDVKGVLDRKVDEKF